MSRLPDSKRLTEHPTVRATERTFGRRFGVAIEDRYRGIVEAARDAAWSELAENIDRSLRVEAARPDLEPGYEKMREARMQALRLVDLSKLSSVQRQRRATEAERAESVGVDD